MSTNTTTSLPSVQNMQKLAFVRYLYDLGTRQSRQAEPLRAVSLLMFHDALELFLSVACSHHGASPKGDKFDATTQALETKLGIPLPEKAGLEALNKARVGLKHYANIPASMAIEGYRATTTSFFQSSAPLLFGLEFESISMIDLVENAKARTRMREADGHVSNNAFAEAALKLDDAFHSIVRDFEERCQNELGPSPSASYLGTSYNFGDFGGDRREELDRAFQNVTSSIDSVRENVRMLSMGIDMWSRWRFIAISDRARFQKPSVKSGDVRFCREFVVETALALQHFLGELAGTQS
jgi:hypothetical protein